MAQVDLTIGGRGYQLACRDGGEARLQALGRIVDAKMADAKTAVGRGSESRELLFAALLIADELDEARARVVSADADAAAGAIAMARCAERLEALVDGLEKAADDA